MDSVIKSANKIIKYLEKYTVPDPALVREIRWYLKRSPEAIANEALINTFVNFGINTSYTTSETIPPFPYSGTNISNSIPAVVLDHVILNAGKVGIGYGVTWDLTGLTSTNVNFRYKFTNISTGAVITSPWMNRTTFISTLATQVIVEGVSSLNNDSVTYPIPSVDLTVDREFSVEVIGTSATNSVNFSSVSGNLSLLAFIFP